ncbi:MAG: hypothetical protein ACE5IO_06425 [Thermoplasmata archaeon]
MYQPTSRNRTKAIILVSLLLGTVLFPAFAEETKGFEPEYAIAPQTSGTNQSNPSLVVSSSGNVYVAWDEEIDGFSEIFVARSTNQGKSFAFPIQLTNSGGQSNQTNPVLGLDSNGVLLVAWEDRTDGDSDIFAGKMDPWNTFTSGQASDGPASTDQINPSLVVDSLDTVHIAWEDLRTERDIRASSASVGTLAFGASVRVDDDPGSAWQHEPSMAIDADDNIYVAWYDRRDVDPIIYLSKSSDGGASYNANIPVENGAAQGPQFEPDITVSGGRIYVIWQDGRSGLSRDIYFASAPTATLAFGGGVRVNSGTNPSNQRSPNVYVEEDGTIHAVWQDFRDTVYDVYYANSTDVGSSFADEKANNNPGDATLEKGNPKIAVNAQGVIYIVWENQMADDSRIMMATLGLDGDGGNGGDGKPPAIDLLLWIVLILVIVLVIIVAVIMRRKSRKEEM